MPDRAKNSKRKTKTKKHTLNPLYDEMLKVSVSSSQTIFN
jgi:synaptotagmin-like protein